MVPPPPPTARLNLGITGHRSSNPALTANHDAIAAVLAQLFDALAAAAAARGAPVRLHSLLADGADQLAAEAAVARGWELAAPLPFGQALNIAINAAPGDLADCDALLAGAVPADPAVAVRAATIARLAGTARCFALAERDPLLARLYRAKLAAPDDLVAAQAFAVRCSARVALAGRVMIEQSDLVIGIWDGVSRAYVGGTGHSISEALEHGCPVLWIHTDRPDDWRILHAPEALAAPHLVGIEGREAELDRLVAAALRPDGADGSAAMAGERWHPQSRRWWTAYRRIEAMFGGEGRPLRALVQDYEGPDAIASGSGAQLLTAAKSLPNADMDRTKAIAADILPRFAWADGISSYLSDCYRGGMTTNFILAALAVVVGIAYQPFASSADKWLFAGAEFLLLAAILITTALGRRWRWHGRWFETRRVAEYLRHAPIMLLLGVARAPGRWPKGIAVAWPEYHARHAIRSVGLPQVALTPAYLRAALTTLLRPHVTQQRDYHQAKARRLTHVHHGLDRLSTRLFQLAVLSVATYLLVKAGAALAILPDAWPAALTKPTTFLGVALPTFGGAIAGIRYFGDFERFAAISEVTAAKLDALDGRMALLLAASDEHLDYARVSELAHAVDAVVVAEIENWQAVFGGKHIAVPV